MLEDAKTLKEVLPQLKTNPKQTVTNPGGADTNETEAQMRERLFGTQGNIFDLRTIREKGGGVAENTK